ncbi:glutaminase GtaA [Pseudomassariella vexata]|uniref:Glutaminase GtaA n=1 Tax=Pseudomassariella vexata TaxID=1141098 RepID=A0A1Y2DNE6_9PEZI|nr:glutaminase GtaA [Pseudomassariella vexata]ORY60757.1 glutaminase GtaA [Pseudomassariella vexata]
MWKQIQARFGLIAFLFSAVQAVTDSIGNNLPIFSPLRPPAVPLAVKSPYTSAWSSTGGSLNSASPVFWTSTPIGWEGIITVDGTSYEYLGNGFQALPKLPKYRLALPQTVTYDSQYSNFTFIAGPITICASFFSPVIPQDTCRSSMPLSYLTTTVNSNDNQTHDVQFYSNINAAWLGAGGNGEFTWDLLKNGAPMNRTEIIDQKDNASLYSWIYEPSTQVKLGESTDFPQWGNFTYTTKSMGASNFSCESGYSLDLHYKSLDGKGLKNNNDIAYRGSGTREAIFAFTHDFYNVSEAQVRYTIGSIQDPVMKYMYRGGTANLRPWWSKCYGDIFAMIAYHWDDYDAVRAAACDFETQLRQDTYRFFENNTVIQHGLNSSSFYSNGPATGGPDEPLVFQKEISSDGNINTVDVLYPTTPFFLYANPELLKYTLQPLYEFQEAGFYPHGYSMHDLGSAFPNATGHIAGDDEYMPVEESGNFILMSYAYYKFSNNVAWLQSHYTLLKKFAQYLIEFSLVPAAQLSTDDFSGRLTNQTNLAIKGIVALQAMNAIARVAENADDAAYFSSTAQSYYSQWETMAVDPSSRHTILAYQWRSSWGLLYNIYFDKLLNLGIVNQSIYTMQSDWYASVSQVFGVPLDSRHHYTKSDWQIWAAATCNTSTRALMVNAVAYWLNHTSSGLPFTDLYEVIDMGGSPEVPDHISFKARPVVGGHYALLALGRSGQGSSAQAGDTTGSLFPKNGTGALNSKTKITGFERRMV